MAIVERCWANLQNMESTTLDPAVSDTTGAGPSTGVFRSKAGLGFKDTIRGLENIPELTHKM